jgi:hypothetical protein
MTFDWAAATDPDPDDTLTYTLELSMDSLFADPVTVDAGEADSVQVAALEQATWYWRVAAQDRHGLQAYSSETWTLLVTLGVAEGRFSGLPEEFALASLYPNPFNPTLTVVVALPQAAEVNVQVYDTMGRRVAELARGRREAGYHSLTFDGSRIASGASFVRAVVPGELNTTRKVVLMK